MTNWSSLIMLWRKRPSFSKSREPVQNPELNTSIWRNSRSRLPNLDRDEALIQRKERPYLARRQWALERFKTRVDQNMSWVQMKYRLRMRTKFSLLRISWMGSIMGKRGRLLSQETLVIWSTPKILTRWGWVRLRWLSTQERDRNLSWRHRLGDKILGLDYLLLMLELIKFRNGIIGYEPT